jgi:hypothetical protein
MDSRPDYLRSQIDTTRAALDRHLNELGTRIDITKERVKANAQVWGAVSAVAAGVIGIVMFRPRRRVPRRVVHPLSAATM